VIDNPGTKLGLRAGAVALTILGAAVWLASASDRAQATDADSSHENWALHGQSTFIEQFHPAFHSPYRGPNSLDQASRGDETFDATLYLGFCPWEGAEIWANPEIDQGFGLSNTLGVAGYPGGEAYKVGKSAPYFRLQRIFVRQTFDLGGETQNVEPDVNQLGGTHTADNLVLSGGKLSVTDIFDTNAYAHDPKVDFMNWALIDSGAFDYAADAWGYSYGAAAEWTQAWWTLRAGLFDLSRVPNTTRLVRGFGQYELVLEGEERHSWWGRTGKLKLLAYFNRGRMGSYNDAVNLALATHATPDMALVRKPATRPGLVINLEQAIDDGLGLFVRASLNDGSKEAFEFSEINRSFAAGLSLKGTAWDRGQDTIGVAFVVNGLSNSARRYFAAGGLGILIGDGQLPHYGPEEIVEIYYRAKLTSWLGAGADYQWISNPAYNLDRGPVSILSARLHAEF
jgi:high affinity Mn2+ porin